MSVILALTIVNALILLASLVVLGLTIKLYTEYFKDRAIQSRKNP